MEALNFLKFWRPISSPKLHLDEEDDSFFELQLNIPNLDDAEIQNSDATPKNRAIPIPLFSPRNLFSGRKVQPFEAHRRHSRRPHPRISLFKPSPHFRTFWSRTFSSPETEQVEHKTEHRRRTNLSTASSGGAERNVVSASKRFSNIVKPFSGRGSERDSGEEVRPFRVKASPLSSPVAAALRLAGKGKRRSGAAVKGGGLVSPARRDESVLVQQEGIQSAILHCKNSLHSL